MPIANLRKGEVALMRVENEPFFQLVRVKSRIGNDYYVYNESGADSLRRVSGAKLFSLVNDDSCNYSILAGRPWQFQRYPLQKGENVLIPSYDGKRGLRSGVLVERTSGSYWFVKLSHEDSTVTVNEGSIFRKST